MPTARIWYEADGSVKITQFTSEADVAQAVRVLHADGHVGTDATWEDVATMAELERMLPPRAQRHKWRKGPTGGVVVDPRVPDPPDPRAELRKQVDAAQTLDDLKGVLREVLK